MKKLEAKPTKLKIWIIENTQPGVVHRYDNVWTTKPTLDNLSVGDQLWEGEIVLLGKKINIFEPEKTMTEIRKAVKEE